MTVQYHPDELLLLAHATGGAGEGVSLLVATHLTYCPKCSAEVSLLEAIGGVLLCNTVPMLLKPDALQCALAQLDAALPESARPTLRADAGLPEPLRSYIGNDLARVPWRRIANGLSIQSLFRRGGVHAYLIKSAPGSSVGPHSHRGNELTLVLAGGFRDEAGRYGRGDFLAVAPEIVHAVIADDDGDCITLVMTDAPLKFRNFSSRLVAKYFGL